QLRAAELVLVDDVVLLLDVLRAQDRIDRRAADAAPIALDRLGQPQIVRLDVQLAGRARPVVGRHDDRDLDPGLLFHAEQDVDVERLAAVVVEGQVRLEVNRRHGALSSSLAVRAGYHTPGVAAARPARARFLL